MSSPHMLPGHDTFTAPLGALPTSTAAQTTATASTPPSPTTYAAAIALATFSDSRPSTSHHDDADEDMIDDDDDDQGGGISLADFQQFMETPLPSIHDHLQAHTENAVMPPQTLMEQIQSWPYASASTLLGPPVPYHMSSTYMPAPPLPMSHLSSSEPSLEPPPTLQEAHLSIQDKASFAPITSFFHWYTPEHPVVPGLDLVKVPASIRREDLQGDRYDCQGIDWTVRNTTRSFMRAKRAEYESAKVAPSQREVRKVGQIIRDSSMWLICAEYPSYASYR